MIMITAECLHGGSIFQTGRTENAELVHLVYRGCSGLSNGACQSDTRGTPGTYCASTCSTRTTRSATSRSASTCASAKGVRQGNVAWIAIGRPYPTWPKCEIRARNANVTYAYLVRTRNGRTVLEDRFEDIRKTTESPGDLTKVLDSRRLQVRSSLGRPSSQIHGWCKGAIRP